MQSRTISVVEGRIQVMQIIDSDKNPVARLAISLRPLFSFAWRMLLVLTVCRAVFVAWQWQSVVDADLLGSVIVEGFRSDLFLLGLMLAIPALCFPLLASNRVLVPVWRALLRFCLPIALLIVVLVECGTPSFVDQLDSRPNLLFLEYLIDPKQVATDLWAAFKLPIVLAIFMVSSFTWLNSRQLGRLVKPIQPTGVLPAIVVTPVLLLLCTGLVRSTLDYEPRGSGTDAYSNYRVLSYPRLIPTRPVVADAIRSYASNEAGD